MLIAALSNKRPGMENTHAPLNYFFDAAGPAARPTLLLNWTFAAIALTICIIIAFLLLAAILRKQPKANANAIGREGRIEMDSYRHGSDGARAEGMTVYMLVTLNESAIPPGKPALTITVTGYDWWWKAEYDRFRNRQ